MLHGDVVFVGIPVSVLALVVPVWTVAWALLGYSVGRYYRRPKRYLLIEDGGAWKPAKLHHADARDDDAPIGLEESRSR
jgi:hypothetical protein